MYAKGKDRNWLEKQIAWAMCHVARPDAKVPRGYRDELPRAITASESATP